MEIKDVLNHNDFILALCMFLDNFKQSNIKESLIENEPTAKASKEHKCILAAVAHKLSNENNLNVPAWTMKKKYIMEYPIYSHNTTNIEYQNYLKTVSPYEFSIRNIYIGEDAIKRV